MSSRLQVLLDFGGNTLPTLIGECFWVASERLVAFAWDKDFVSSTLNVSPIHLPFQLSVIKAPHTPFDGLHGLFADSIPDGFGLRLMNQGLIHAGLSLAEINPLHRLAWVGQHGVGALSYKPIIDSTDHRALNQLSEIAEFAKLTEAEIIQVIPPSAIKAGGSALGARPKFWASLTEDGKNIILGDTFKNPSGFIPSLLKFAPAYGDQNEPFYEAACLSLAQVHGIHAASASLLLQDQATALAVKRFDRTASGERVHTQSVAALLNDNFRIPHLDYIDLVRLSGRLSSEPQSEMIFRQACFNVALSIRDDHSKNFAFCMDQQGSWKLSPAFDLCPCDGPNGWHTMTISGEGQNITRDHLLKFAQSIHLSPIVALDAIENALSAASQFEAKSVALGASKSGAKKWAKKLNAIGKELLH